MKQFIDLSPEESKGLDTAPYQNAQVLYDSAFLISKNKNTYSVATSLLILSCEEMIKAIIVKLHSEGIKIYQIENARKFFTDHSIRHEIAQLIETGTAILEGSEVWENQKKNPLFKTKNTKVNYLGNIIYDVLKSSQPILKSVNRVESLRDFNKWKNRGFYADYSDKLLEPSKEIDEKKYYEVREINLRIIKFYRFLTELYDPTDNSITKENKIKYRKELKILIDSIFVEEKGYKFNKKKIGY